MALFAVAAILSAAAGVSGGETDVLAEGGDEVARFANQASDLRSMVHNPALVRRNFLRFGKRSTSLTDEEKDQEMREIEILSKFGKHPTGGENLNPEIGLLEPSRDHSIKTRSFLRFGKRAPLFGLPGVKSYYKRKADFLRFGKRSGGDLQMFRDPLDLGDINSLLENVHHSEDQVRAKKANDFLRFGR